MPQSKPIELVPFAPAQSDKQKHPVPAKQGYALLFETSQSKLNPQINVKRSAQQFAKVATAA